MGMDGAPATSVPLESFLESAWSLMLAGDSRITRVARHLEVYEPIRRRAAVVRHSVWNLQRHLSLRGLRTGLDIAGAQDVAPSSRQIVSAEAVRLLPIIPSALVGSRVGPTPAPLLVTDEEHVFLGGPDGTELGSTIWESTDPEIVAAACAAYTSAWEVSRPAEDVVDRPLLPPRLVQVAFLLVDGASDREIADALGVGARTASSDVRRVIEWSRASGRPHAIAVLSGGDA